MTHCLKQKSRCQLLANKLLKVTALLVLNLGVVSHASSGSSNSFMAQASSQPRPRIANYSPLAAPAPISSQEFVNKDCVKTDSCDLKSFKMEVWKSSTTQGQLDPSFGDLMWSDMMVAGYETKDNASLDNYGVVQFIQGCSLTKMVIKGKTQTFVNSRRGFFDFDIPFIHPSQVVDSFDLDPLYASVPYDPSVYGATIPVSQWKRLASYRIHKPNFFVNESPDDQTVYQWGVPPEPKLYISDLPSGSYANVDRKTNPNITYASMKFKTCIYKTKDIPFTGTPDWTGSGKEIACFEWQNNHRYDPASDRFVDASTIDPICLDQSVASQLATADNTPPGQKPLDWTKSSANYSIPANSCDAPFGAALGPAYFAGDFCRNDFNHSADHAQFLQTFGPDNRYLPNIFEARRVLAGGLTSVQLSTLRSSTVPEITAVFRELKAHATDILKAHSTGSDTDAAVLNRIQNLAVRIRPQGAGCDGGDELLSQYDSISDQIQLCPAWTNMPNEALLETLANGIADAMDVCSFLVVYQMQPKLVTDLKKANPTLVRSCFASNQDLSSETIINLVLSRLQPEVSDGQTEYIAIQTDIDNALQKCGLVTPSARHPMPTDFQHFVTSDLWNCGRKASGDQILAPVPVPFKDKKACSDRVRDIHEGAISSDLISYYLGLHSDLPDPATKQSLIYSALRNTCAQQSSTDATSLGSQERLGLYLTHPEVRAALGCTASSAPVLCESQLFH